MSDDTAIDFTIMNPALRARLTECLLEEDMGDLRTILALVPDGTPVDTYDPDVNEDDLPSTERVALMIDYFWGNFA